MDTMPTHPPREDIDESDLHTGAAKHYAAGPRAVLVALERGFEQMGPKRTAETLVRLNHRHGFDCPGCAWPDPDGRRRPAEFCENGAKAVAEEATTRVVDPAFFARHSVADLAGYTDYWLGQQGRLTHPMVLDPGATHYRPISWEAAYTRIAEVMRGLDSPHQAAFYTSGRASNEAAFLYQLFARSFGTNNLPDCSNMCHESSGSALTESIGIGKGSVTLEDVEHADLILVIGQNPGTNHPRMLTALEHAKKRGGTVIAINPLIEAGLLRFKDPQSVSGVVGHGTAISDEYLQIRIGGDQALFQGLGKLLLEREAAAPGTVVDHDFIERHCAYFDKYADLMAQVSLDDVVEASGLTIEQIEQTAEALANSQRTVICWAMGLTQHRHGVATIRDATNLLLMRGMIGKPGAGVCPVRGHSNVQGDRTMGIWEKMPDRFLDALDAHFSITSPREHGHDTVDTIRAMRDGQVRFFLGLGGNFARATPDTEVTEAALRSCEMTVHVSTKLNRSHVTHGRTALILPTLGRTDRDIQNGTKQMVSVEDSMSMVHLSRGRLDPVSEHLRSEVAIVCEVAEAVLGSGHPVRWDWLRGDYDRVRDAIAAVVPGCTDYNTRVREKNGFELPHPPRDNREFPTSTGRANFSAQPFDYEPVPPGRVILQTLRSHDQFNTTIYGLDDRYRGIKNARRVVMMNPKDIEMFGLLDGDRVDVISEWTSPEGVVEERRVTDFAVVAYDTPVGNAAAYYPETNPLIPLDNVALVSNTPVSKAVTIRVERAAT